MPLPTPTPTPPQQPGANTGRRAPVVLQPGRGRANVVIRRDVKVQVDWVVEAEVPHDNGKPRGTFLQFASRRAFFEDNVQIRIQISGLVLSAAAKVSIRVFDQDPMLDDGIIAFTNDSGTKLTTSDFPAGVVQRPIKVVTNIETQSFQESSQNLLLEADAAAKLSFLLTTINLPVDPSGSELDGLEYFFIVHIDEQINGKDVRIIAGSPQLDGFRWSADPQFNLGFRKTNATKIVPLVDGDAYFTRVAAAINAATSQVCVASWTMDIDTPMGLGGQPFSDVIFAAAKRGVVVNVLHDAINGFIFQPTTKGLAHPRIRARISRHPFALPGVGQLGSYHEKYVIVDGKRAFPGGIDVSPDRVAPVGHAAKLAPNYFLWHDVGVELEGNIVDQMQSDFARRWNEGIDFADTATGRQIIVPPAAENLAEPAVPKPPATGHNVQLVKSDTLVVTGSDLSGNASSTTIDQLGTRNAFNAAILGARRFVYIENQYFRDSKLGDTLEKALQANPELQVIVVVPFFSEEEMAIANKGQFPEMYAFALGQQSAQVQNGVQQRATRHGSLLQFQLINRLRNVSNAASRVGIFTLARCSGGTPEMIYPHAKIAVVDDTWAYIGSANTNGRSFGGTDAEIGAVIHDRGVVSAFRQLLWKEHLGQDITTRDVRDFVSRWTALALKNKKKLTDCSCAELATVHAIDFIDPPKGQKYNGPLEAFFQDDFV